MEPIHVLVCPDSFKNALPAPEVAAAIREGIERAAAKLQIPVSVTRLPLSDGGEGMGDVLGQVLGCSKETCRISGPLGEERDAHWWWHEEKKLALIETAEANGIEHLQPHERNPLVTTTRGVGELLETALRRGAKEVILGIGGSATVDGGKDMATVLGYRFLDASGHQVPAGGGGLRAVAKIISPEHQAWRNVKVEVLCDVTNPLTGELGAAKVFGPQKGATPAMVAELEQGLRNLARLCPETDSQTPGAGAAGGLGFGLMAFVGAKLVHGFPKIAELVHLRDHLKQSMFVITGEGCSDEQSAYGKICGEIARMTGELGLPCVILSGALREPLTALRQLNPRLACLALAQSPEESLEDALAQTAQRLALRSEDLFCLFLAGLTKPFEDNISSA